MTRLRFFLAAAALVLATLAAQPALALDCANASTTVDMLQCADIDYQAADKRLNRSYGAFKKTLDAEGAKLLLESQRAWLKYRDTNCALAADQARGGTMAPLVSLGCQADMTAKRAKELDEFAGGR